MLAFNQLVNRYIIGGEIIADGPLHIGSGAGDTETDALFVRSNDKIYLPGSSVRGAMRSTIEKLTAGLLADEDRIRNATCFLDASSGSKCISCNKDTQEEIDGWREAGKNEAAILADLQLPGQPYRLCHVCRLFGSPSFASKVKIQDCYVLSPAEAVKKGNIRYGIGIDRDTESVREGLLFDYEAIETLPAFRFELIVENIDETDTWDWGLLALGLLEMMRSGGDGSFFLGAKSAAGLGRCHLKSETLEIEGFSGPNELLAYLTGNQFPQRYDSTSDPTASDFMKQKRQDWLDAVIAKAPETNVESTEKNGGE